MRFDDFLCDGEAETSSLDFATWLLNSIKAVKNLLVLSQWYPKPIVLDRNEVGIAFG